METKTRSRKKDYEGIIEVCEAWLEVEALGHREEISAILKRSIMRVEDDE